MEEHRTYQALPNTRWCCSHMEVALWYLEHTAHKLNAAFTSPNRWIWTSGQKLTPTNLLFKATWVSRRLWEVTHLSTGLVSSQQQGMLLPQQTTCPNPESGLGEPSGESHNKSCYNSGFKGNRSGGFEHEGKLNRFLTVSHCLSRKKNKTKNNHQTKKQTKPTTTTNLRKDKGTGILISLL